MTRKLEPCPFCGSMSSRPWEHEEGCYLRIHGDTQEDWYTAGYHRNSDDFDIVAANEHQFDRHSNEDLIQAWNTRYKRKCHGVKNESKPKDQWVRCSECNCGLWWQDPTTSEHVINFCPSCGAEVVDV